MFNKQDRDLRLSLLAGLVFCLLAAAMLGWDRGPPETPLTGPALTKVLMGNRVSGTDAGGRPFTAWFGPDGSMTATVASGVATLSGQLGAADGDDGSWRVRGNVLCVTWSWWNDGAEVCYRVTRVESRYRLYRGDSLDSSFRLEPR